MEVVILNFSSATFTVSRCIIFLNKFILAVVVPPSFVGFSLAVESRGESVVVVHGLLTAEHGS